MPVPVADRARFILHDIARIGGVRPVLRIHDLLRIFAAAHAEEATDRITGAARDAHLLRIPVENRAEPGKFNHRIELERFQNRHNHLPVRFEFVLQIAAVPLDGLAVDPGPGRA